MTYVFYFVETYLSCIIFFQIVIIFLYLGWNGWKISWTDLKNSFSPLYSSHRKIKNALFKSLYICVSLSILSWIEILNRIFPSKPLNRFSSILQETFLKITSFTTLHKYYCLCHYKIAVTFLSIVILNENQSLYSLIFELWTLSC